MALACPSSRALLVVHLEEEQVGELFDVVAVRHAVVAQDVAVVPEALDDGGGPGGHWVRLPVCAICVSRRMTGSRRRKMAEGKIGQVC